MKLSLRLAFAALFAFSINPALAQQGAQQTERQVVTTENADYFGFDLRAEKNVSLDQCKQACVGDPQCRAFTFNVKAGWCFLKSDFKDLGPFVGAVAGRIVEVSTEPDIGAAPVLDFVSNYALDEARSFRRKAIAGASRQGLSGAQQLLAEAAGALASRDYERAEAQFAGAMGVEPDSVGSWVAFAKYALAYARSGASGSYRMQNLAVTAAINAYQLTRTNSSRANALSLLAETLEQDSSYRAALNAFKASLELVNSPVVADAYRTLRSEKGFRVTGNTVDADTTTPRACVQFSEDLVKTGVDYGNFVSVDGKAGGAIEASGRQICAEGLAHGNSYRLALRAGLPSSVDESLEEPVVINVYVRDRAPAVRFTGENFVLPGSARQGIPIIGINADKADLQLYRVGDRSISRLVSGSRFLSQLEGYSVSDIAEEMGAPVWKGSIDLAREFNKETVTSVPLDEVLPRREPGIYVLTATVPGAEADSWEPRATQWFLVSDIGLTAYSGVDGLTVFARSLDAATPMAGVELSLIARNNELLGTAVSDANGVARFEAGLIRGKAGMAPVVVTARNTAGDGRDYVFLDLDRAGFDLSDRGVTGRAAPGPVDIFAYTERGIYRPGETVHAMALARDDSAQASEGLPLTIVFERPDGVEAQRTVSNAPSAGGHGVDFLVPQNAMRGVWKMLTLTDPDSDPVAEKLFLVEDFVPDRIEFDLTAKSDRIAAGAPATIEVDGRYLYGAPANDLALEGEMRLKTVRKLDAVPGYVFGLAEEEYQGDERKTLADLPRTGADGKAQIEVALPELPSTTRPLSAEISVRMREDGGRAVERKLSLPVAASGPMIGLRPDFGDSAQENSQASFRVLAVDAAGQRVALAGLEWKLYRIERNYQWYRDGSYWRYEAVQIPRLEASGALDVAAGEPAAVSAPVKWGQYRFEVASAAADGPATSHEFNAGYFVAQQSAETPDALEIALDRESYAAGDVAKLKIASRFAGQLLVAIGSDRLFETMNVPIPATGGEVEIPIKAEWGAGAYITATLFRPGSSQQTRMPMRAIGTTWLAVEPGERRLSVSLDLPEKARPRDRLTIPVKLAGMKPGEDAFVTVAAVDVGILNLTRYEAPDPTKWYFGQRQLGLELRDLYGRLIDGSQGAFGRIRTGGDGPALSADGNPPTEKLLALFSGIVRVDAEGKAIVDFDLPEFNGTARVMAVAWSKSAVGQAQGDVIIRDPVVLTASLPKVLAPGDKAQTVLEIANTDGPAGTYELSVATAGGLEIGAMPASIELAAGERKTLQLPLVASASGDGLMTVTIARGSEAYAARTQSVTIRPATLPVTTRMELPLAAGGSVTVGSQLLAQSYRQGASVSVSVSRTPGFNVAGLLTSLDRYPYGCAEQTTSRALPLLYLSDLDAPKALLDTPDLGKRIDGAITRVLSYQSSSGSFGLWGPDDRDMWLDAYVADFLTRAREKGHAVPDQAMRLAVTNLQNKLGYQNDLAENGNAVAYALYVLARNRLASAADLRYYADIKLQEFATPLARAQIAAALSLYNEVERAGRAYRSALDLARAGTAAGGGSYDYGSKLRDGAAMLALASETRPVPGDVPAMMDLMVQELATRRYTSTQEQAWMLLAARAAQEMNAALELTVNGAPRKGALSMTMSGEELDAAPLSIANPGNEKLVATVTTLASPIEPLPAGGEGFAIERTYYTLDGEAAQVSEVEQNQRYVVVLTVTEEGEGASRILVTDLLPGGFEIDNPRLVDSASLEAFSWLGDREIAHSEFRSDRFVAAVDRGEGEDGSFSVAYVVRAVTPGTYTHPAASVEDMYRPELSARTATGFMQVKAAQ